MQIRSKDLSLIRKYTITKRNINQTERVLGRRVFDRSIKLFTNDFYFPNGAKHYTYGREYNDFEEVDIEMSGKLRDYQLEAVLHIHEQGGGLIEAPTGSGKSLVVIGITNLYKTKTLIVCPTKKLVSEMVDKFKQFTNYEPGTYYSDGKNIKDITITTHTSFVKDIQEKGLLKGFNVVIVDEADDKASKNMIDALCKCDCDILVGLTGTPSRQDLWLQDLELIFGPHIKVGEYAMMPTEITHYIYNRSRDEGDDIDYTNRHTQRESIIANENRTEVVFEILDKIRDESFLTLVLLDRNLDVEKYSERYPEALVITGDTKVKDDEAGIEILKKKGGLIVGSIKKMYRGVDIPECDSVVIASPIKFENTVIQSIGRALRKSEGKKEVKIHIINDNVLKRQRYEQSKVCEKIYGIKPNTIYLSKPKNPGEEKLL